MDSTKPTAVKLHSVTERRLQEDIQMDETGTGVRMKSERGRGGVVEDVTYRRIHMKDIAGQCVQVTLNCE